MTQYRYNRYYHRYRGVYSYFDKYLEDANSLIDKIYGTDPKTMQDTIKGGNSCRVGFTNDPKSRMYAYMHEGFVGVMLRMYVEHGKSAEQALLNLQHMHSRFNQNIQKKSNISKGIDGYVYCLISMDVFKKLIDTGKLVSIS